MDSNINKALWLGVTILLFVAVVTIGITIFNGMKHVGDEAGSRITGMTDSLANAEFSGYNGKEVKGDDVLSAIQTFAGDSGERIVLVRTLGMGAAVTLDPGTGAAPAVSSFEQYVSTTGSSLSVKDKCYMLSAGTGDLLATKSKALQDAALRDAEDQNATTRFINPAARFMAQLVYDNNQKIRGVAFAQID